jgi:sulfur carrier protein ThiS
MEQTVTIRLEVYLPYRGARIWRGAETVPAGTTLGALVERLALREPELAALLNGRHAPADSVLSEGDEVAVLRQAEGG